MAAPTSDAGVQKNLAKGARPHMAQTRIVRTRLSRQQVGVQPTRSNEVVATEVDPLWTFLCSFQALLRRRANGGGRAEHMPRIHAKRDEVHQHRCSQERAGKALADEEEGRSLNR